METGRPSRTAWRAAHARARHQADPRRVFAPLDFERGTLDGALDAAGLDRTRAAFFIWLGVTPYLTRDAVLATLRAVAAHPAPVQVVFDYYREPSAAMAPELRAAYEAATRQVAELGEPWLSHFTPDGLAGELRAMGLADIEDLAGPDLLARYLGEPAPAADACGQVLRAGRTADRRPSRPSRPAPSPPRG